MEALRSNQKLENYRFFLYNNFNALIKFISLKLSHAQMATFDSKDHTLYIVDRPRIF